MEGGVCGLADGVGEKKNKKASCRSHSTEGRKKEDQDMGVIASGCRIAWHMGPFGGVFWYCPVLHSVARTVCTRTRAPATSKRVRHSCSSPSVGERGEGGRETTPLETPPGCHSSKPIRASRASTPQAAPG